jgi:hypothetical protein
LINFIAEKARSVVAADTERVMTNRNNLSTIEYVVALTVLTSPTVKSASEDKLLSSEWLQTSNCKVGKLRLQLIPILTRKILGIIFLNQPAFSRDQKNHVLDPKKHKVS